MESKEKTHEADIELGLLEIDHELKHIRELRDAKLPLAYIDTQALSEDLNHVFWLARKRLETDNTYEEQEGRKVVDRVEGALRAILAGL